MLSTVGRLKKNPNYNYLALCASADGNWKGGFVRDVIVTVYLRQWGAKFTLCSVHTTVQDWP
jgi:hypothetical protein